MNRLLLFLICASLFACDASESEDVVNDFDRETMLVNWADNMIIPAYTSFASEVTAMDAAVVAFAEEASVANLETLRVQWQAAYLAWQNVAMYQIGEAETLDMQGNMNTYPTNNEEMETLIAANTYNLALPSRRNVQGFPAIDYLINGLADTDESVVAAFENSEAHMDYLIAVSDRIVELSSVVLADWEGGYRDDFVANNGSSATSSVNKLVNDFIFYFEARVRSKKVSTPAGVSTGTVAVSSVEAFYQNDISKLLLEEAISVTQDFFEGKHFNSSTTGESLKSYIAYISEVSGQDESLNKMIDDQYTSISEVTNSLADNFSEQITSDITKMYEIHEALNNNVQFFKTDMLSLLSIKVDYVDADGD